MLYREYTSYSMYDRHNMRTPATLGYIAREKTKAKKEKQENETRIQSRKLTRVREPWETLKEKKR